MKQNKAHAFGAYIKQLRKGQKLTLKDLATKSGINLGSLSHIEQGTRMPQPATLKILAKALDVPLADMLAMGDYPIAYDLPSITPYLHARYGHLSKETLSSIDAYLKRLIDKDELDPGGPLPFEDETNGLPQD